MSLALTLPAGQTDLASSAVLTYLATEILIATVQHMEQNPFSSIVLKERQGERHTVAANNN